jgi:hypothetical protein
MRTIRAALLALAASLPIAAPTRALSWTEGELMVAHQDFAPEGSSFTTEPFAYQFTGSEPFHFAIATPLSLASVSVRTSHGWARVVAAASGAVDAAPANQLRIASAGYGVHAGFQDEITIDAPGLTGQPGSARIGIDVDGAVSAGADAWPGQSVATSFGAATIRFFGPGISERWFVEVTNPAEPPDTYPAEGFHGFLGGTAQFVFGTPFAVEFVVTLSGNADALSNAQPDVPGAQAAASMVGDFADTFTWAGIADLRDQNGAPLPDFEVSSLSGTDYRHPIVPVPEPGTALLVLAAMATLASRRRR